MCSGGFRFRVTLSNVHTLLSLSFAVLLSLELSGESVRWLF